MSLFSDRRCLCVDFTDERAMVKSSSKPVASVDSTAETGHPGAGDLQEKIHQMIKSLKDQYFVELKDLYNGISIKIQHIDNQVPSQKSTEQSAKMKRFNVMLEGILNFLQVNKSSIEPHFILKIPIYEKQIVSIVNSIRRKPLQAPGQQTFQSGGQAPSSDISQQNQTCQGLQQHDTHTDQKPQASLPGSSGLAAKGRSEKSSDDISEKRCLFQEGLPDEEENMVREKGVEGIKSTSE